MIWQDSHTFIELNFGSFIHIENLCEIDWQDSHKFKTQKYLNG